MKSLIDQLALARCTLYWGISNELVQRGAKWGQIRQKLQKCWIFAFLVRLRFSETPSNAWSSRNEHRTSTFVTFERKFVHPWRLSHWWLNDAFMHRLSGYTSFYLILDQNQENAPFSRVYPWFWGSGPIQDLQKSNPKSISGPQKMQNWAFFCKKNVKNGILRKIAFWTQKWPKISDFGPQNDPKWPILTHFGPQNDPKSLILDLKMAKIPIFGIWTKIAGLDTQKVPFWAIFRPKNDLF